MTARREKGSGLHDQSNAVQFTLGIEWMDEYSSERTVGWVDCMVYWRIWWNYQWWCFHMGCVV
jgi:hypothetical protein